MRRHADPSGCRAARDEGFTLVEAMVAAAIMMVFVLALSTVLVSEMGASKIDRQRVSASTLAAREQEIVRNKFASNDASALLVASTPELVNPDPLTGAAGTVSVLDGTSYTIERDTEWLPVGNGASACDGGSLVTFPSLRVHVEVTWPNMGAVKPVVSDTVLTPPKTVNNANVGYIAVKVTDRNGAPNVSRNVMVVGPGGSQMGATDTSGCATFQFGTAGNYTISLGEPGFVDYYGVATPSKLQALTIGSLQRLTMTYDLASTVVATYTTLTGFSLPTNLPAVTISNTGLQGNAQHTESFAATAGGTTSIGSLWPFLSGYTVWAGGCLDADPAASPTNGSRAAAVMTNPGVSSTVTVPLAPVLVTVAHGNGTPAPAGLTVTATSQSTGCLGSEGTLTLGTTDALGVVRGSLPYGNWTVKTTSGSASAIFNPATTGITNAQVQIP